MSTDREPTTKDSQSKNIFLRFASLPFNVIMAIPRSLLQPTQPDDGQPSRSEGKPIEGYVHDGKIQVGHGNHRYWREGDKGPRDRKMKVVKVEDPHANK